MRNSSLLKFSLRSDLLILLLLVLSHAVSLCQLMNKPQTLMNSSLRNRRALSLSHLVGHAH